MLVLLKRRCYPHLFMNVVHDDAGGKFVPVRMIIIMGMVIM